MVDIMQNLGTVNAASVLINGTAPATTGKAIAMAIVFG